MNNKSNTMKRVIYNRHGSPEVLEIQETAIPKLTKGQVLVQNFASSINGGDLNVRKGFKNKIINALTKFPKTTGQDVVGKVVAIDKEVTDFKIGDMVWGNTTTNTNGMAEYVAIESNKLSFMPTTISPLEAASIPCAGDTALVALVYKGKLKAGERVLIRGAGGVGFFAVQIAKSLGAHVTVLGSKTVIEKIKKYGADEVFDYHKTALEDLDTFDLIFDSVGTNHNILRKHLTKNGRLLTIAFRPLELVKLALSVRFGKHRSHLVVAFPNRENLTHLAQLVDKGDIITNIDSVYPIDQIVDAHKRAEQRGIFGKIVVDIAGQKGNMNTIGTNKK